MQYSANKNIIAYKPFRRFLLLCSLVSLFLICIISVILGSQYSKYKEDYISLALNKEASYSSSKLSEYMNERILLLDTYDSNSDVINYLNNTSNKSLDETEEDTYFDKIKTLINKPNLSKYYNDSIWIMNDKSGIVTDSKNVFYSDDSKKSEWYKFFSTVTDNDQLWINARDMTPTNTTNTVEIIKAIRQNKVIIGYVGISADFAPYINTLDSYKNLNPVIITDHSGNVIFQNYCNNEQTITKEFIRLKSTILNNNNKCDQVIQNNINTNNQLYITENAISQWSISVVNIGNSKGYMSVLLQNTIVIILFILAFIIYILIFTKLFLSKMSPVPRALKAITDMTEKYGIKDTNTGILTLDKTLEKFDIMIEAKDKQIDFYRNCDSLTGLPNNIALKETVSDYIKECSHNQTRFAIIIFDIYNLSSLNNLLGHDLGDTIIHKFSIRLSMIVSPFGKLFRFFSDKFAIVIKLDDDTMTIENLITKVNEGFESPLSILKEEIFVKTCTGISIYPDNSTTCEELIKFADSALYTAKYTDLNKVQFYSEEIQNDNSQKSIIGQKLINALSRNELYLNFQPIILTNKREIYGFEVLVRWNNPDIGQISPAEFIPIAEENGMMVPIGTWIFETACRYHKNLCQKLNHDYVISINVSAQQLLDKKFVHNIKRVISITKINPELIQIELTETVLVKYLDDIRDALTQLAQIGIRIALDDFGTGYSSLNYLRNLPINCLKIDKSFVEQISTNSKDYNITDSIIDLVHSLDITAVAEGVETVEQLDSLGKMSCDLIQGFFMSRPLDNENLEKFITDYQSQNK